ncbi:hypothetical protein [Acinetobacter equi]|uniref:Uncharacterized protein n=1 Tax=Acinetobacter equi TaxID=1324350 RepID=A0A0N9WE93_9GAMM|nr:hypothetical protein [Acinetobacter equi]ALH95658.1 hypothetical protein AOY20_09020 [Acinetobacter equi]
MKQIHLDSLEEELNFWSPIMELQSLMVEARDFYLKELFPYEKTEKNIPEDEYIKDMNILFTKHFTGRHSDPNRPTGIQAEEEFFSSILDNETDEELKKENLNSALYQLLNIVCMYICDAAEVLKNIKKEFNDGEAIIVENSLITDNKIFYYLCKANYFIGLCKATHAGNLGSKVQLREKMIKLAEKRNKPLRKKLDDDLLVTKKIWEGNNWATYTQCAEHIFEKKLVDRPYRKIYELVSLAAKNK